MTRPHSHPNLNQTEINRKQVFRCDVEQLYSEHDLEQIRHWNEQVNSRDVDECLFATSTASHVKQKVANSSLKIGLAEVYCALQYSIAQSRYKDGFKSELYSASEVFDWFSNIKDNQTISGYLDSLVDIGLLHKTRHNLYTKVDEDLGSLFETIAREGHVENTEFAKFPDQNSCRVFSPEPCTLSSAANITRLFWTEHSVGRLLTANCVILTIQLLIQVSRAGTVSTPHLVGAYLLTWVGLIGIFAFVIGRLRRSHLLTAEEPSFIRRLSR